MSNDTRPIELQRFARSSVQSTDLGNDCESTIVVLLGANLSWRRGITPKHSNRSSLLISPEHLGRKHERGTVPPEYLCDLES
jgi:hypothetical protein